jgi:hypothetical protein
MGRGLGNTLKLLKEIPENLRKEIEKKGRITKVLLVIIRPFQ